MKNEPKTNSNSHAAKATSSLEAALFPARVKVSARVADYHITSGTGASLGMQPGNAKDTKNRGNELKESLKINRLSFFEVKNELKTNSISCAFGALMRENTASFRTSREYRRRPPQVIRRETGATRECPEKTSGQAKSVILSCTPPGFWPPGAPSAAQPDDIGNPRPTPPPAGAFHIEAFRGSGKIPFE